MSASQSRISGQMTINLPGVIKTLGTSLYSDPSVSVRELIQNANDTCVVRQADDPQAPPGEIHINFDAFKRILVVEDNGAGMTEDEVKEFLTVIGSSKTDQVRSRLEEMGQGSLAEHLIGRFGLGLLSAFIIGDKIEFSTLSYKEGAQAIWWECDGGQSYTMRSDGRTVPGTKVTVNINPKHIGMLKDDRLTNLIHLYADLLSVPIYLDPILRPVNIMTAPWHQQASETEYRQFVMDRYPDDAILDIIPVEIEEDEGKFKVGGVLFVPKQPVFIVREHGDVIVYVRRMFVRKDERSLLPDWAKFVKGVIESPNLRETTSRETIMRDENLQRVQRALGKVILDYLARISNENPRLFKELVTNHNLVIKAWAIASDELFDRIKDIVLFTTDAGLVSLPRYFEMSRTNKGVSAQRADKRYIFYFTTPGGAGSHTMLFAAKGLRVIDAQKFPDESFLQKYASKHEDVILKLLDVGGDFIFEELEQRERKWVDLEDAYSHMRIDAKVVKFVPDDIPAVLIFPETEPVTDQVEGLLADPNLSTPLKNLVRQMWSDREKQKQSRISSGGILYVNANNPVIINLVDLDLEDLEIQEVMTVIYNNALMLSAQGARMYLTPGSSEKVFKSNNRTIAQLMTKIYEVRELKAQLVVSNERRISAAPEPVLIPAQAPSQTRAGSASTLTSHISCFVAFPFEDKYKVVLEALRDVLEVAPYFWEVTHASVEYLARTVPENVSLWIERSHCFIADLSDGNENVLLETGLMYWAYKQRPLLLLQRTGSPHRLKELTDLGPPIYITYPWDESPNQSRIAEALRREIEKHGELKRIPREAHYLSARIMPGFMAPELARVLAKRYKTVEEFVGKSADSITSELSTHAVGSEIIQGIQRYLRDLCDLR